MIPFYSKRNQVYPILWQGRAAVEKHFTASEDWRREAELYAALSGNLPVPEVLESHPKSLVLGFLPHETMLEVLERQEKERFSPEPWEALTAWLKRCYQFCGQLPGEGNLRNFLWDEERRQIIGLDFESYEPCAPKDFGAVLIAAVLEYSPADTPVKRRTAQLLAEKWEVSETAIATERQNLRVRREKNPPRLLSGIVLAGGASKRMGRDKAELRLLNRTLLQWQVDKLQELGIQDIMISGENCATLPGTRVVPDEFPHRGPLGGLHACLRAAQHPQSLVLGVDVPLVPVAVLAQLCRSHSEGVTVLRHAGKQEPLIGVYDSVLSEIIPRMIRERGASVQALSENVPWKCFDYLGPEVFLKNCNTPLDITEVQDVVAAYVKLDCFAETLLASETEGPSDNNMFIT